MMETTLDTIRDIKLYQRKSGYRFSVDALLLYSFVNLRRIQRIIDLGAGSGIVGLLLAKKYPESGVTLIELQESLYRLAEKNIQLNNLEGRVKAVKCDIRKLAGKGGVYDPSGKGVIDPPFDLAVSNPPFRKPLSGRLNVEKERAIARHEIKISLRGLVRSATSVLRNRGRFCLIYHPLRLSELVEELREANLEPKRLRFVHGRFSSEAKMVLLEAVKDGSTGLKVEPPLFVYREDGTYTDEMKKLYEGGSAPKPPYCLL